MMRQYIFSHGAFWFVIYKYYFGGSGLSDISDVLANSYLNTTYFERWLQSISFDCREVRKRKGCIHSGCSFCGRIVFDRSVGSYIVKLCRWLHTGHVINLSSIPGHIRFESDLFIEERSQLANFGKIGYTGLQSKSAFCRLFFGRTYDSAMMYSVVRKARTLHYGDATDCMLKLVELVNSHSSKGGVFEMASDKDGRLKILHWSGFLSSLFVDKFNDFTLIDGTHKTNTYDLSLIVTTTVDSLVISVHVGFLLAPSEILFQSRIILII